MKQQGNEIAECVRRSLERYFKDLDGTKPRSVYDMVLKNVERPMLEAIASPLNPVVIREPPFAQDVSEALDLRNLPIPKWFPGDGGRRPEPTFLLRVF